MKEELNNIILMEIKALGSLLKALENQYRCLINSDAVTLENCIKEIETCNKSIAEKEVARRKFTKGKPMKEIISETNDENLDKNYSKIKRLLEEVKVQKDSNELLIKQGLSFTNRILNILNPSRTPKTYNSYGKVSR